MIDLKFEIEGLDALTRKLRDLDKRQIPYATKEAINGTLERILKAEQGTMKQHLDNPNRWTLNSLRIDYAKKDKLYGKVWFKDGGGKGNPAYKYLSVQEEGGERREKGLEKWLRVKGYLPAGWYVVPAKTARLDRYGNITRGMHTKIMSDLRANADVGWTSSRAKDTPGKFFVPMPRTGAGKHGSVTMKRHTLPLGIYQRMANGRVKGWFMFVQKKPHYKARLPWYPVAQKTFDRHFEREFDRAFERAMRTAR